MELLIIEPDAFFVQTKQGDAMPYRQIEHEAYKDVSQVVLTIEGAGIARRVAKLKPLGVIKG